MPKSPGTSPSNDLSAYVSSADARKLSLNPFQLQNAVTVAKKKTSVGGRGSGKSNLLGWEVQRDVYSMPRSLQALAAPKFETIITRTLPPILSFLERLGYEQDKDFVIGRKPPRKWKWPKPYFPVQKYERVLLWHTGAAFIFTSQDRKGSSRSLSVDGIKADESLLLDRERFGQELIPANRGNLDYFGHIPWHHSIHYLSSMPLDAEGNWLLQNAQYYKDDGREYDERLEAIVKVQLQLVMSDNLEEQVQLFKKMRIMQQKINWYVKTVQGETNFYSEGTAFDNIMNIGLSNIRQMFNEMDLAMFLTEVLNSKRRKVLNGFYPNLAEHHFYGKVINYSRIDNQLDNLNYKLQNLEKPCSDWDGDIERDSPLEISVDWGASINSLVVCQEQGNKFKVLKNFYVKHPKILDHLMKDFCEYYKNHPEKMIYFYYDRNGNNRNANSDLTYAQQAAKILIDNGWTVQMMSKGLDAAHMEKYLLWQRLLLHTEANMPFIEINKDQCKELKVSMEDAPVKQVGEVFKKDKKAEGNPNYPQEEATHLSDALDVIVYTKYSHFLDDTGISRIGWVSSF